MRDSWDQYFMKFAEHVSTRATCDRLHVGAVIVGGDSHLLVSTGYNGAPRNLAHCDDVGHELKNMGGRDSCIRTVHAEANAVAHAARHGNSTDGATCYVTVKPCYDCLKLLINAGITRIVYGDSYPGRYGMANEMEEIARSAGIKFERLTKD